MENLRIPRPKRQKRDLEEDGYPDMDEFLEDFFEDEDDE